MRERERERERESYCRCESPGPKLLKLCGHILKPILYYHQGRMVKINIKQSNSLVEDEGSYQLLPIL